MITVMMAMTLTGRDADDNDGMITLLISNVDDNDGDCGMACVGLTSTTHTACSVSEDWGLWESAKMRQTL